MATVFAKQTGNWTDTTLWAFWNETTQQVEDYGQVPQPDDVVYCNGYTVTIDSNYIKVKELRNGVVAYTSRVGGKFQTRVSHTYELECDIYSEVVSDYILTFRGCTYNESHTQLVIGNIYSVEGAYALFCTDARYNISINGNCEGQIYYTSIGAGNKTFALTLNGNAKVDYLGKSPNTASAPPTTIIVNGNVDLYRNLVEYGRNLSYTQNGILSLKGEQSSLDVVLMQGYTAYTITLNGILSLDKKNQYDIFSNNDLSLKTQTSLTIETSYDYPAESNVKKDVVYAYGRMVGTYDINQYLPPESVVLKDFEYGDSDDRKIGTMPVLSQQLISRLENCATVETVQQLLVAHLDD